MGRKRPTRFSFAVEALSFTSVLVKRRNVRGMLIVVLLISVVFAAWGWFRPYAWNVDAEARCKVVGTQVKQDHSYFWVDVHLEMNSGQKHDLMKPVRLITATGSRLEPAETTLAARERQGTTDLWFKFWLETPEIAGPLKLQINDGELVIKKGSGMPKLGSSGYENFVTQSW